jgi:hypothetical protein
MMYRGKMMRHQRRDDGGQVCFELGTKTGRMAKAKQQKDFGASN